MDYIFKTVDEANGHNMGDLTFSLLQRTSPAGYFMYGWTWILFQVSYEKHRAISEKASGLETRNRS